MRGETIQYRPHGNSMTPLIQSGQLVTIAPCKPEELRVGDIVLCKVRGREYLHKITALGNYKNFQISNNHGHVNGWTRRIFGKLVKVEP